MMHNNLFLNRLVVFTETSKIAYDEQFHDGINIIRGDNSSGKSTISHFIFYILGGAFNNWVKEAKRCSQVLAEVKMNGATLTLRREINVNENTNKSSVTEPIYIFWRGLYRK
jgi:predicted ATPase